MSEITAGLERFVDQLNSSLHGTANTSVAIAWKDRAYLAHCVKHGTGWACFLTDVTELRVSRRRAGTGCISSISQPRERRNSRWLDRASN